MQDNKIKFQGNRSSIYEGSKKDQKRRRELTLFEQRKNSKVNFRGNRSSIYEGSKKDQKRRRELTFLEQQQSSREAQQELFKKVELKFSKR